MTALIPPISSIVELELTPGIWTPHGRILCVVCHGKLYGGTLDSRSNEPIDDDRFEPVPLDDDDCNNTDIAVCDECGKDVWMVYKIAWEQKIVAALKEKGHDAHMSQTGGMCSAAELILDSDEDGGQKYVWITESEDVGRPHNDPTFMVGYYHCENPYGDDAEGEDYSVLPFAEAVALAETIMKEGGLHG